MIPSSLFLLQLLTGPVGGDLAPSVALDEDDPPVIAGLIALAEGGFFGDGGFDIGAGGENVRLKAPNFGDVPLDAPVAVGLNAPPRFGPIVVGNFEGMIECATRLNAPRHCKT